MSRFGLSEDKEKESLSCPNSTSKFFVLVFNVSVHVVRHRAPVKQGHIYFPSMIKHTTTEAIMRATAAYHRRDEKQKVRDEGGLIIVALQPSLQTERR